MLITTVLLGFLAAFLTLKLIWASVFIAFVVLLVADWLQTVSIAQNPSIWSETNKILGTHPSVMRVHAYFAGCLLIAIAVVPYVQWIYLPLAVMEGYFVVKNYRLGILFARSFK